MKLGNCYRAFLVMMVMSVGTATLSVAAGPWKGRIVDLETKEPLEGAVALAVWERVYRTPAGPSSYFYNAKEVLTDKEGRFEIPAYRPINLLPLISFMRGPHFTVFKPGYLSLSDINLGDYLLKEANIAPAELMEKGKAFRLSPGLIELPRLKTREERKRAHPSPVGSEKDWEKQKEYIEAIRQDWEYLTGRPAGDLYRKGGK